MSPRAIRLAVVAVFVGGIGGMIGGSIADNNGIAVTFGLVTAVAALCLMVTTAVGGPGAFERTPRFDERTAGDLEARIAALVAEGCDEAEVRDLVRTAVRMGRDAH